MSSLKSTRRIQKRLGRAAHGSLHRLVLQLRASAKYARREWWRNEKQGYPFCAEYWRGRMVSHEADLVQLQQHLQNDRTELTRPAQ
jgi:hypothetical protein